MKKFIRSILLAAILLSAAGCSFASPNKYQFVMPNAVEADLSGYNNIQSDDGFMEITSEDVISSIGNKEINAYIFMGSITCHYCQDAIVEVQKQALNHSLTIHYLSIDKIESQDSYDRLVEVLTPILQTNKERKPVLYMPHLFKIENGELVDGHLGFGEGYDYSDVFTNKEN